MLAKMISDNYDDVETRMSYIDLTIQIVLEQPFKIPFVAAIVVVLNGMNRGEEAVATILAKAAEETERRVARGEWREVKLLLKFLGSLQGLLVDDGVWSVLAELFERAVDLQTASSEDVSSHNRDRPAWNITLMEPFTDSWHGARQGHSLHYSLHYGFFCQRISGTGCRTSRQD